MDKPQSTNLIFDASDVPLGARSVDGLAAGAASAGTTTLTIPAEIAAGTYYIVAQADSANAVAEAVESNNIAFSTAIQIGLDLTVSRITAPAVAGAGAAIVIVDTTLDRGTAPAPPSTTGFYLSSNFALDAGDLVLGNRPVPALEAGASDTASTSLSVPATVATGTYFIVARADNANAVAEANESNNLAFSSAIRIGPDLTQGTTTAPATGGSGRSIVIGDTAKNTGGGAAGASTTGLYLSTSVTLTASATQLGARSVPPLAPGASDTASTAVILPANLATGTYYVIASADVGNQVLETSETNNAGFGAAIRIGPDLIESALTAPTSASAGSAISVTDGALNQGGGSAVSSTTRFYLSTNVTLDGGDVMVGSRSIGALAPGQSSAGQAVVTIPASTAPGSYFLIAAADADGAVAETIETNNARAVLIQVK